MEKEEIKRLILELLKYINEDFEDNGYTFLEIRDYLNKKGFSDWNRLKEKLIEERLFGIEYNGRVDYAIEPKRFNLINDKKR